MNRLFFKTVVVEAFSNVGDLNEKEKRPSSRYYEGFGRNVLWKEWKRHKL